MEKGSVHQRRFFRGQSYYLDKVKVAYLFLYYDDDDKKYWNSGYKYVNTICCDLVQACVN